MGKITKMVGAAGVAAGAAYLSKKENRSKVKGQMDKAVDKVKHSYVKNLGKPSEVPDANMVSEGALTSVQYYNNFKAESEAAPEGK